MRLCASAEGYLEASSPWLPAAPQIEGLVLLLPDEAAHLARVRGTLLPPAGAAKDPWKDDEIQLLVVGADTDPSRARVFGGALQVPLRFRVGFDPEESLRPHPRDAGSVGRGQEMGRALARGGTYELALRAAGPARVLAHSSRFGVAMSEPLLLRLGQEVVAPPIRFAPETGGTLRGRLVAGGEPRGGRILLQGEGLSQTVAIGADGSFRLTSLPAGRYDVAARGRVADANGSPEDVLLATARVSVVAGQETLLTLDTRPDGGSSIAGLVVSPDEAIERWRLALIELSSQTARGAPVDEDGTFRFDGVKPGDYLLALRSESPPRGIAAFSFVFTTVERDTSPWVELRPSGRVDLLAPQPDGAMLFTFVLAPDDPRLGVLLEEQEHAASFDEQHAARVYGLPPRGVTFSCGEHTARLRIPSPPGTTLETWN